MNISEKIEELLKYCSVYQGHVNMMDERRTDGGFQVRLPEEDDILAHLDTLQFILLTGEAGGITAIYGICTGTAALATELEVCFRLQFLHLRNRKRNSRIAGAVDDSCFWSGEQCCRY